MLKNLKNRGGRSALPWVPATIISMPYTPLKKCCFLSQTPCFPKSKRNI